MASEPFKFAVQIVNVVNYHFPNGSIVQDSDGQVVIYTGYYVAPVNANIIVPGNKQDVKDVLKDADREEETEAALQHLHNLLKYEY